MLIVNYKVGKQSKSKMQTIFTTDGQTPPKYAIPEGIKRGQTPLFPWS